MFYSRVARNLVGSREKQCGDDLNTAVGISLPRWSGNAVIVTALAHVPKNFSFFERERTFDSMSDRNTGCKKNTWFCNTQNNVLHTEWDHAKKVKKSWELFIWILALSREVSVLRWGRNLAIGFLGKITFFSKFIYVCFVGNVAVSVWLASVWQIISCD